MPLLNWQQIDTVLLDMDGTLLDLHFDTYFWQTYMTDKYAEKYQVTRQQAEQALNVVFEETQGTLDWYCLDFWTERLQMPVAELKKDIREKIGYRPFVKEFLSMLREKGIRTLIVTNAHRDSVGLKMEETRLDSLVDHLISSHDYQEPKESQAFWQHLQNEEAFDPARTLLIDDSHAVLRSARKYGIGHLLTVFVPDSQQPANLTDEFNGIHHFDELLGC